MTRFLIGLLLGALVGIAGTAAFLIVYGGGDYLVSTSPRVRQLEGALSRADEDRDWLKARLREATDVTHRLESRFEALAARFERLSGGSDQPLPEPTGAAAIDAPPPAASDTAPTVDAPSAARDEDEDAASRPSASLESIPTIAPAQEPTPIP